jgi:hypothetical protein
LKLQEGISRLRQDSYGLAIPPLLPQVARDDLSPDENLGNTILSAPARRLAAR